MAQSDYTVENGTGAVVRADINVHFNSVATLNSGATSPLEYVNQWWLDTTNNLLRQRNNANTAWVNIARKDSVGYVPYYSQQLLGSVESVTHSSVGNYTPDTEAGTFKDITVEAGMTIQIPGTVNVPTGVAYFLNLLFTIDSTGGYSINWSSSYNVVGRVPDVPNAADKQSAFLIWTIDGGATWYLFGDLDKTSLQNITIAANDDLILLSDTSASDSAKSIQSDRLTNSPSGVNELGDQSGTITPDFNLDNYISFTLTGAVTVADPLNPPLTQLGKLNFAITADGTNDVTWSSGTTWGDGTVPNIAGETAGVIVRVTLETWDGGVTYFGYVLRNG